METSNAQPYAFYNRPLFHRETATLKANLLLLQTMFSPQDEEHAIIQSWLEDKPLYHYKSVFMAFFKGGMHGLSAHEWRSRNHLPRFLTGAMYNYIYKRWKGLPKIVQLEGGRRFLDYPDRDNPDRYKGIYPLAPEVEITQQADRAETLSLTQATAHVRVGHPVATGEYQKTRVGTIPTRPNGQKGRWRVLRYLGSGAVPAHDADTSKEAESVDKNPHYELECVNCGRIMSKATRVFNFNCPSCSIVEELSPVKGFVVQVSELADGTVQVTTRDNVPEDAVKTVQLALGGKAHHWEVLATPSAEDAEDVEYGDDDEAAQQQTQELAPATPATPATPEAPAEQPQPSSDKLAPFYDFLDSL